MACGVAGVEVTMMGVEVLKGGGNGVELDIGVGGSVGVAVKMGVGLSRVGAGEPSKVGDGWTPEPVDDEVAVTNFKTGVGTGEAGGALHPQPTNNTPRVSKKPNLIIKMRIANHSSTTKNWYCNHTITETESKAIPKI